MPAETRGPHLRSMGQKIKTRLFFRRMVPDRSIAVTGTDKLAFHGLKIVQSFTHQYRAAPSLSEKQSNREADLSSEEECEQNALRGGRSF